MCVRACACESVVFAYTWNIILK